MNNNKLYNGANLDFTGSENPYALIQKAGKRRTKKLKSRRKCGKKRKCKTRKYRR
jgi:hypothetical protein